MCRFLFRVFLVLEVSGLKPAFSQKAVRHFGETLAAAVTVGRTWQLHKYQPLPWEPVWPDLSTRWLDAGAAVDFNYRQLLMLACVLAPERQQPLMTGWTQLWQHLPVSEALISCSVPSPVSFSDALTCHIVSVLQHDLSMTSWVIVNMLVPLFSFAFILLYLVYVLSISNLKRK